MRILMVNKFLYPNGGSETYTMRLGQWLSQQGHRVEYFGMEDERNTVGNSWVIPVQGHLSVCHHLFCAGKK